MELMMTPGATVYLVLQQAIGAPPYVATGTITSYTPNFCAVDMGESAKPRFWYGNPRALILTVYEAEAIVRALTGQK